MRLLNNLFTSVCAHILPTSCISCGSFQRDSLCLKCTTQLTANGLFNYVCCLQCGVPLQADETSQGHCIQCIRTPPYFDQTICLDRYLGCLQNALHLLKYQKRLAYAHGLAQVWDQFIPRDLKTHHAHFLLPVPLSKEKLAMRGFNQSWEIARRIQCPEQMQRLPNVLLRLHHPVQQALASRSARELAIRDQFYINPLYRAQLEQQTVVVFDDVMTTGATFNEIARILKDNGVLRVINWAVLRTLEPQQTKTLHV